MVCLLWLLCRPLCILLPQNCYRRSVNFPAMKKRQVLSSIKIRESKYLLPMPRQSDLGAAERKETTFKSSRPPFYSFLIMEARCISVGTGRFCDPHYHGHQPGHRDRSTWWEVHTKCLYFHLVFSIYWLENLTFTYWGVLPKAVIKPHPLFLPVSIPEL